MQKSLARIAALLGVMALSGCIESTTTVAVRKDGSGFLMETTYFGAALQQMMSQMAAAFGGEADVEAEAGPTIDMEKCEARAKELGEGVSLVSAKPVEAADGRKGQKVIYAFKDVRKLELSPEPQTPAGPGAETGEQPQSEPITFGFTPGDVSTLTVNMPRPAGGEAGDKSGMAAEMLGGGEMQIPPEQLAQMQQMFDGFRVHIMVKVDGDIKETNASHVHKSARSGKKQYVTLFDMNIGEMMKSAENMPKLAALGPMQSMSEAAEKLKDFPGLTVETASKVEIQFK